MFNVSIFGSGRIDSGMLEFGESVISLAFFGSMIIDLASHPPPPGVRLSLITIFGGAYIKVRPQQVVRLSGFSLFGGRSLDSLQLPAANAPRTDDDEEPVEIVAYSLFGGIAVRRVDAIAAAQHVDR